MLDLVRIAAALLVLAFHYGMVPLDGFPLGVASRWTHFGWVGVQIFFVVSGYVIAISAASGGGVAFFCRRLARLLPAIWICGLITTLAFLSVYPDMTGQAWQRFATSALLIPVGTQVDIAYWSLGVELNFYLLVALVVGTGARHTNFGQLGAILGAISGLWIVWTLMGGPGGLPDRAAELLLLDHGVFFAMGIGLWEWHARRSSLAVLCILLGLVFGPLQILREVLEQRAGLPELSIPAWPAIACWLAGVAAVAGAHRAQRLLGPTARPLVTAGLATYPIYLLHCAVGIQLIRGAVADGRGVVAAIASTTFIMIGAALVISRYMEPPLRRMLSAVLRDVGKRRAVQSTAPCPSSR